MSNKIKYSLGIYFICDVSCVSQNNSIFSTMQFRELAEIEFLNILTLNDIQFGHGVFGGGGIGVMLTKIHAQMCVSFAP